MDDSYLAKIIEASDDCDDALDAFVAALERRETVIRNARIANPSQAVACNRVKSKNSATDAVRNAGLDRFIHLQTTKGGVGGFATVAIDTWGLAE